MFSLNLWCAMTISPSLEVFSAANVVVLYKESKMKRAYMSVIF